jgi:hypothetical protein
MNDLVALALGLAAFGWNTVAQVPAGSRVLLRAQNAVSSRTAKPGDSIYLVTVTPVAADGRIVIAAGSQVRGEVTQARKSAAFHRRGELAIELRTLILMSGVSSAVAGQIVALDSDAGEPRPGPAAMDRIAWGSAGSPLVIGGMAGILSGSRDGFRIGTAAGLGAKVLLMAVGRGGEVQIHPGSQMEAILSAPITMTQ